MVAESFPHPRRLPSTPASAAKFTHWNPPTCMFRLLQTLEWHLRSSCFCPQLCGSKNGALQGWYSFPTSQLPPKKHLQQHTTSPHSSSASTRGSAWMSHHISVCHCIISELKTQSQMLAQLVVLPTSWVQEFSQESKDFYLATLNHLSQPSTSSSTNRQLLPVSWIWEAHEFSYQHSGYWPHDPSSLN